jgi:2-polyprenyl-3-methyl-5-hydroxy-6-metoxy-1,4-benzoquinol methylase
MSLERLNKCPACKSGLFLHYKEIADFSVSKENFLLCKCSTCKLTFTNPRPDKKHIGIYYQSQDYISHQDASTNLINWIYKQVRTVTIKNKISWLKKYSVGKGSLLDVGSGTGYFLEAAKKKGWNITGIEPSETARKIALKKKLKVKKSFEDVKPGKKFDAITLFHVLEHIHDLRKTAKNIMNHLQDDGTIFIAVPNNNSLDAKIYDKHWAAWDVPRHLYHFNIETLTSFTDSVGLKVIDQVPMKFDSYYVSLLSEKYMNPKANPVKRILNAVINGYKSNSWAKNNNNNYSSVLFILKRK